MNSIIAGILRNQAETLRGGLVNMPHNLHLIERVLPDGLPGDVSYNEVIEELERFADDLESEE